MPRSSRPTSERGAKCDVDAQPEIRFGVLRADAISPRCVAHGECRGNRRPRRCQRRRQEHPVAVHFGRRASARRATPFEDASIDGCEPEDVVRRGIVHVPEGRRIFPAMTVRENLEVGGHAVGRSSASIKQGVEEALQLLPAPERPHPVYGRSLSGGEQQMLAVGRGLMAQAEAADARRAVPWSRSADHAGSLRDHSRHQRKRCVDADRRSRTSRCALFKMATRCYVIRDRGSIVKHPRKRPRKWLDDPAI